MEKGVSQLIRTLQTDRESNMELCDQTNTEIECIGYFRTENTIFPDELTELILSLCDMASISKIRLVCQKWNEIVKRPVFWKMIMSRYGRKEFWNFIDRHIPTNHSDAWQVFMSQHKSKFLYNNFVKNPVGKGGYKNWDILSGPSGGWVIHPIVGDAKEGPLAHTCFATYNFSCSKEQVVDLWEQGFNPAVMRACVPFSIVWSEWIRAVGNPACYECKVNFLDRDNSLISPYTPYEYLRRENLEANCAWKLMYHEFRVDFSNASEVIHDLRYVQLYHGGMSTSNIFGILGPQITDTRLCIQLLYY